MARVERLLDRDVADAGRTGTPLSSRQPHRFQPMGRPPRAPSEETKS
jgi:hypothetical protein